MREASKYSFERNRKELIQFNTLSMSLSSSAPRSAKETRPHETSQAKARLIGVSQPRRQPSSFLENAFNHDYLPRSSLILLGKSTVESLLQSSVSASTTSLEPPPWSPSKPYSGSLIPRRKSAPLTSTQLSSQLTYLQVRKCNQLIRQNTRKLDRDIAQLKIVENKTKTLIINASKRAQRNPSQAKQAAQETRVFARELIRTRKTSQRLVTSKAQLNSVAMQVQEAFAVRKIEGSIRASVGIMKDVNSLVRLPELTGTMQELSRELVKAGIIEEMVGDSLPDELEEEDEEAETEVDKVLGEILQDKMSKVAAMPVTPTPVTQEPVAEDEDEEDAEAMLDQMRGRLEALKS